MMKNDSFAQNCTSEVWVLFQSLQSLQVGIVWSLLFCLSAVLDWDFLHFFWHLMVAKSEWGSPNEILSCKLIRPETVAHHTCWNQWPCMATTTLAGAKRTKWWHDQHLCTTPGYQQQLQQVVQTLSPIRWPTNKILSPDFLDAPTGMKNLAQLRTP